MGGNEAYLDRARRLSIEQRAALCLGGDIWHTAAIAERGIEQITLSDGPHGLRRQPEGGDHVGIGGSLPATCFPPACGLASSWNPELAREIGDALGVEARAQDVAVVLGPGLNIKRSPLCGRNFEYLSEDPFLAGRMGAAMVRGIQAHGVGACPKHFAVNNQETDRMRVSADVDDRTLREIYLPAFEHIVTEAAPWTVMCAYNKINGTYASEHHWLLTELLRDEWGFDGLVMSDWGAVHDRVAAVAAGLDLEMPPDLGHSDKALVEAVSEGRLAEGVLDLAAARVLQLVRPGRRPQPGRDRRGRPPRAGPPGRRRVHRAAAQRRRVLPLAGTGTVAVLGELARTPRYQGAGSSQVIPTRVDDTLDALTAALPDATVRFAPGYPLDDPDAAPDGGADRRGGRGGPGRRRGRGLPRAAVHRRVRGLRPRPHGPAAGPARAARRAGRGRTGGAGGRRALQRLGRAHQQLGRARRRPCSSAGWAGRPAGRRWPTCSPARSTRPGSWPRRSR